MATAIELGVAVPALTTALTYYDGYRSERLPANLLQAAARLFRAHTYARVDRPGTFHTDWLSLAARPRHSPTQPANIQLLVSLRQA